jgi:hypothetical protein
MEYNVYGTQDFKETGDKREDLLLQAIHHVFAKGIRKGEGCENEEQTKHVDKKREEKGARLIRTKGEKKKRISRSNRKIGRKRGRDG